MKRSQFLVDQDVKDFIDWCKNNLPRLKVSLQIKSSRFVPNGLNVVATGLGQVLRHYTWKSKGMDSGDWNETVITLNNLANQLRSAVDSENNRDALVACKAILEWGGNRNYEVGAYPFLCNQPNLCGYLLESGKAFNLESADEAALAGAGFPIGLMNSMLTKVHALFSRDGLPIYDSRVAAAIASLIELWRNHADKSNDPLPKSLSFPATMTTRTVLNLFPNAHHPGVMIYGNEKKDADWSSAKVRLGWLMEKILECLPKLFASETNRMHALEASLFMIGYNVTSLGNPNTPVKSVKKLQKALTRTAMPISVPSKRLRPLSGRGTEIEWSGNVKDRFRIRWGNQYLILEPTLLEELVIEFGGRPTVALGAEQSGRGPKNSLGVWLKDAHNINPRFASAIAPILKDSGIIRHSRGSKPILLDFA